MQRKSSTPVVRSPQATGSETTGTKSGAKAGKPKPRVKRKAKAGKFHANAAGIDIGAASHFVAVPADRDSRPVREFKCFTEDLERLADWLKVCGIEIVAMESTGVYWIPLFELLEARGFTVLLVNARHISHVPGRKSDVLDCQWLQHLLTCGLLSGAFRPKEQICALRAYTRQRAMLLTCQATHIQHMQKALTQMNIQLTAVISDVVGMTGQRIVRAIVAGERDGAKLAAFRDHRVKASEAQIASALRGTWRPEHLFALRQALELFDVYGTQLAACDDEIEAHLQQFAVRADTPHASAPPPSKRAKKRSKNAPRFDARTLLYRMSGVDLTQINGIEVTTALTIMSEIGPDLSRFRSAKAFTSWLGLCPGTKISGGKRLSGRPRHGGNRAAQALRLAASALRESKSALGAWFRRISARMDAPKAITAGAHKLARLVYALLTKGQQYVDAGTAIEEARHRDRQLRYLNKKATSLGFALTPMAPTLVS
jgi:transposase